MARYASLSLNAMKESNEMLPEYFFSLVRMAWGRELKHEELVDVFNKGVFAAFTGNNPPSVSEVRYVLFLKSISKKIPLVLNINTYFAVTDAHQNIISRFGNQELIAAGILRNGRFSEISSEWVARYTQNKPEEYYHFGISINKLMLRTLQIDP